MAPGERDVSDFCKSHSNAVSGVEINAVAVGKMSATMLLVCPSSTASHTPVVGPTAPSTVLVCPGLVSPSQLRPREELRDHVQGARALHLRDEVPRERLPRQNSHLLVEPSVGHGAISRSRLAGDQH